MITPAVPVMRLDICSTIHALKLPLRFYAFKPLRYLSNGISLNSTTSSATVYGAW